jgi:hypothetical protein
MIVATEPADLLMVRFKLYFNQQQPDPEDAWVLAYFEQHGLQPRRELYEEHDGVPYKLLHFGQCYLGRHVEALGHLYQRGIEHTVLAQHIQDVLTRADDATLGTAAAGVDATAWPGITIRLAAQLYDSASFEPTEDKQLRVIIDPAIVYQAFLALQAL